MKFILAVSENNVIGVGNKLPWHIPHDLKWFKMNTFNKTIIMGRKTFESMPPLKNRKYHVVSRNNPYVAIPDAICIGGAQLVESIIRKGDIMYLTHVSVHIDDPNSIHLRLPDKKRLWRTKTFHGKLDYYFAAYQIK